MTDATTTLNGLTGKVPPEHVHAAPAPIDAGLIERLRAVDDLSGTVSDALDEIGIQGALAASTLVPRLPGSAVVGTAVTVRNIPQRPAALVNARERLSRAAEIEGHNQCRPGDVLVIQGVPDVSNMGGISSTIGKRQGEAGAIVDGGIRDLGHMRQIEFPVWSRAVTPITSKWRVDTVEVNGTVTVGGVTVGAGDLVVADDTGVCFVPREHVQRIVERCEAIRDGETQRHVDIDAGMPVPELSRRTYVYQYGPSDGA